MSDEPDPARRRWLRGLIPKGAEVVGRVVAAELERRLPKRLRPPGAVSEPEFLAGCTQCRACVEACPQNAIFTLGPNVHPGAGTPVMVPDQRACAMCAGFPCVTACEPRVLLPPGGSTWKLGVVSVVTERCLPFRGPECGACAGLCPEGTPALGLRLGRPSIDEAVCCGCGLCIPACPVNALEFTPGG